jgi:DNA replication licensing factor MCM7
MPLGEATTDRKQWEKAADPEGQFKLVESIERNCHHYIEIFSRAVDQVLPRPSQEPKYNPTSPA